MAILLWLAVAIFSPQTFAAAPEPNEDPITQCGKQPASKLLALEHEFPSGCPALQYFKQSMGQTEAYFTWCTRVIQATNELRTKQSSLDKKAYEQKREALNGQRYHLHLLVDTIAEHVRGACKAEH